MALYGWSCTQSQFLPKLQPDQICYHALFKSNLHRANSKHTGRKYKVYRTYNQYLSVVYGLK